MHKAQDIATQIGYESAGSVIETQPSPTRRRNHAVPKAVAIPTVDGQLFLLLITC